MLTIYDLVTSEEHISEAVTFNRTLTFAVELNNPLHDIDLAYDWMNSLGCCMLIGCASHATFADVNDHLA